MFGKSTPKEQFLSDLRGRLYQHVGRVQTDFLELETDQLTTAPDAGEWNVLQCFDHLNLTHDYYAPRIAEALARAPAARPGRDTYAPSFWGQIYMHFALNPRYSFPTAESITPRSTLDRGVLSLYLAKQEALATLLSQVAPLDLRRTPVSIEKGVRFNLGDCLKILVYHDELHIGQAGQVLQDLTLR